LTGKIEGKIQVHHLKRRALIYVRQSSMRQVMENKESTARQYALVDKAADLGWAKDLIDVIDDDLGKSASSTHGRGGFQRLVATVAMGQVGIVMGLEMSRLARNNADFHQLLQICGTNNTLIYDADAVYDLMRLNDRLVLGLKGSMSEAELFTIRARLQGGALNKAARAELKIKLPIGFIYCPAGKTVIDPDSQVQESIRLLFTTFKKLGSAKSVVRYFSKEQLRFPTRPSKGHDKGQLVWQPLSSSLVLRILHNPRYAGAYSYGRTKLRQSPSGGASYSKRERSQWHALVTDAHPGYISWDEFEAIEARLTSNALHDFRGPVREGNALLQGLVLCGKCGRNFATSYKKRRSDGQISPIYICNRDRLDYAGKICTYIPGSGIDDIVASILLEKVTPVAVDAVVAVQHEITKRAEVTDKLMRRHVDRAQYEADLAKRRVMSVDPENRLVAQTFEEDWNAKLSQLEHAKLEYEQRRKGNRQVLDDETHAGSVLGHTPRRDGHR
jgi:DNA invertase Pin-like site-specific DNA recombinase